MPRSIRLPFTPIGPSIAYIPLTQGKYALIDAEDVPLVSFCNWCATNHTKVAGGWRCAHLIWVEEKQQSRIEFIHVFLMKPVKPLVVDHINRNPLDNRRANLRIVSKSKNRRNSIQCCSSYEDENVGIYKRYGRWQARIEWNNRVVCLGTFEDRDKAVLARRSAEDEYMSLEN